MTNDLQTSTNTLQTLANTGKQSTNYWPTTRLNQMVWLSVFSAATLIGQYMMLGEVGLSKQILGDAFNRIELGMWAARALVEAFVVVYISMTKTSKPSEESVLNRFKVALIILIFFTVGPVWIQKQFSQDNLSSVLTVVGVYVWGFSISGITAIMLWGVATAYKYQPNDNGHVVIQLVDYEKMLAVVGEAESRAALATQAVGDMLAERDQALAELRGMREAVDILRLLPASAQAQVVAMFNENITANSLAESFGLSPATVRGVFARLNSGK